MRIEVGCRLREFKRYYKKLALNREWQGTFGFSQELDTRWDKVLVENPSLLVVWREDNEIIGHAIWHETSTEEHRHGDPRDKDDSEILRQLIGGKRDLVELHEVWLRKRHRGKGYGEKFFEFFEEFIRKKGYNSIVYYADHPVAIAICRKRGYKEGFLKRENWHVFCLDLDEHSEKKPSKRARESRVLNGVSTKEDIVRKGYDKIAEKYQADRHLFENCRELEEFASLLPKNAKVLDAGCGSGVPVTQFLVRSGFDVTGIDFSESMLRLARKNVPEARFIEKNMTELDFEDDTFDGVTAFYSIIHVPKEKHPSLLQNFHRILKPEGLMLICMGPDEWEATEEYYGTEMFWSHYSPEKSLQLVRDAGFKVVSNKLLTRGGEKHYWILAQNKRQ